MFYGKNIETALHALSLSRLRDSSLRREPFGIFEPCRKERRRMYRDTLFYTLLIRQPALRKLRSVATFSRKRRLNRAVNPRAATVRGIKDAVGEGLAPPATSVTAVHYY